MTHRTLLLAAIFTWLTATGPALADRGSVALEKAARAWLQAAGPAAENARFAFADRERRNWHFTPRRRAGLMIGDMDARQKEATAALMRATLSAEGVVKATDIMRLEAVLAEIEGASLSYRNPEGYYVSLFGEPGRYPWGWRLEGHHLSINVTAATASEVSATPFFAGTNPAFPPAGAAIAEPIQQTEMTLAARLIQSFSPDQATAAKLDDTPWNIITGPGRGDALKRPEGLMTTAMTDSQRQLLQTLVDEYIGMAHDDISRDYRAQVEAGMAETAFAWTGEASAKAAFYYRIHGPRLLIEFDNTRGGDHIHAVWRDPLNDFGRDALKRHYADSPHAHDDRP